jgi:murein DD-endopeptidase MepM/ murein hydrolase activator NlpD
MDIRTATQMERAKRKAVTISALLVVLMVGLSVAFMALSLSNNSKNTNTPVDNPLNQTPDETGGENEVPISAPIAFSVPLSGSEWTVLKTASLTELQRNNTLGRWELCGGYDLGAAAGTGVVAAYDGTVKSVSTGNTLTGTVIRIEHTNGLETVYSSLGSVAENITEGTAVTKGQTIGTVGTTAGSERYDTPYVRFETYENGVQVDPAEYADFSVK